VSTKSAKIILTEDTSNNKMSYKIMQLYMLYITTEIAKTECKHMVHKKGTTIWLISRKKVIRSS